MNRIAALENAPKCYLKTSIFLNYSGGHALRPSGMLCMLIVFCMFHLFVKNPFRHFYGKP